MTLLFTMDLNSLVASYFVVSNSGGYIRFKKYEFLELLKRMKTFEISYRISDALIAIKYENI